MVSVIVYHLLTKIIQSALVTVLYFGIYLIWVYLGILVYLQLIWIRKLVATAISIEQLAFNDKNLKLIQNEEPKDPTASIKAIFFTVTYLLQNILLQVICGLIPSKFISGVLNIVFMALFYAIFIFQQKMKYSLSLLYYIE